MKNEEYITHVKERYYRFVSKDCAYCPKHEKVIITACVTSLNKNCDTELFKSYYCDYWHMKTSFMGWRGRCDWFDFHRTVLSHFIWTDDTNTFFWTWTHMCDHIKNMKKKYPKISDWRRRWYLTELGKLRLYIVTVCCLSHKIRILEDMFRSKLFRINKKYTSRLLKFGYEIVHNQIVKAQFTSTKEWKWLLCEENNVKDLNIYTCFDICMRSNCNKKRLYTMFTLLEPKCFGISFD